MSSKHGKLYLFYIIFLFDCIHPIHLPASVYCYKNDRNILGVICALGINDNDLRG